MNNRKKYSAIGVLIAALYAGHVGASDITFNGYASLKGVKLSHDGDASPFYDLPNEDDGFSFSELSVFGLQAKASLGNGLDAYIQLVADGKKDFELEARWAYMSYQLSDNYSVSMGKFANPLFAQSEYEQVGFVHPYANLPKSVYIGFDSNTVNGIAFDTNHYVNGYSIKTKTLAGRWSGDQFVSSVGEDYKTGLDKMRAFRVEVAKDWWSVVAGALRAEYSENTELSEFMISTIAPGIAFALQNGSTQAQADELRSIVDPGGKDLEYDYWGFNTDNGTFLTAFEYAEYAIVDALTPKFEVWYLSAGYRFGDSTVSIRREMYSQDAQPSALDSVTDDNLYNLGAAVQNSIANIGFDGVGATYRYDFHSNAALKFDYFDGSKAVIGDYKIFTVGVDLVF